MQTFDLKWICRGIVWNRNNYSVAPFSKLVVRNIITERNDHGLHNSCY